MRLVGRVYVPYGYAPTGSKKLYRWRIARIRGTPAEIIGHVEAPDAETAVKEAIREYGITDPEKQKRLIAQRME